MFDQAGNAILIDFGLSNSDSIKTGTPNYFAPEQQELLYLRPEMNAKKLDVWSLGQTLAGCLDRASAGYFKDDAIKKKIYNSGKLRYNIKCQSDKCRDFINKLLTPRNQERPSISEMLNHEWIKDQYTNNDVDMIP